MPTKSGVLGNTPSFQPSDRTVFSFLRLPRELRDAIYRHSIVDGNLGILKTSKVVNKEASELLSKYGVLRVNLGFTSRTNWVHLELKPKSSIQHVELSLSTGPGAQPIDSDLLLGFGGKDIIRESCLVTVNYGKEGSAPYNVDRDWVYQNLQHLNGFKKVVIKIVIEKHEFAEFEGFLTKERFAEIFPYESRLLRHHKESYERVGAFLEVGLGPAEFDDSVDGHCLEFQPLQPLSVDWKPVFDADY